MVWYSQRILYSYLKGCVYFMWQYRNMEINVVKIRRQNLMHSLWLHIKYNIQENPAKKKQKCQLSLPVTTGTVFTYQLNNRWFLPLFYYIQLYLMGKKSQHDFQHNPRDSLLYNEQSISLGVNQSQVHVLEQVSIPQRFISFPRPNRGTPLMTKITENTVQGKVKW